MEDKDLVIKKQFEIIEQQVQVINQQLKINEEFSKVVENFPKINKLNIEESQKTIRTIVIGSLFIIGIISIAAIIIVSSYISSNVKKNTENLNLNNNYIESQKGVDEDG